MTLLGWRRVGHFGGKLVLLAKKGGEAVGGQNQQMTVRDHGYFPFCSSVVSKFFSENIKIIFMYLCVLHIFIYFIIL